MYNIYSNFDYRNKIPVMCLNFQIDHFCNLSKQYVKKNSDDFKSNFIFKNILSIQCMIIVSGGFTVIRSLIKILKLSINMYIV